MNEQDTLAPGARPRDLRHDSLNGLKAGLVAFWDLAKVMLPALLAALVLEKVGAIDALAGAAEPVMRLVGLPGEAAVPLVVAWVLNLYAAIAAMAPLGLSAEEVTILALAILIGHNLLVEGAVVHKAGMNGIAFSLLRAVAGLVAAGVGNQLMDLL